MDEGVDQVVVQKEVSDSEEAPASTSSGSSFSSPTVTRSTVNKRKWLDTPDFLDWYLLSKEARESEKEECRREKEEHREQRREQNDENYLFALGLIPALRRLSPAVQFSVKLKIHQLLHDAEFGQASSAFFLSSRRCPTIRSPRRPQQTMAALQLLGYPNRCLLYTF